MGHDKESSTPRDFEAALKRSEHLLSLVLNTLPVAVQVMDRNGNIILSNPACRKIWGKVVKRGRRRYDSVQAYWVDTDELVQPEEWASTRARLSGEITLGQLIDIRAFDGRVRTILNSSVPIIDEGDIIGAVVVNEDVTDRRLLERRATQAQRLEAVGLLAGGVAHDFNNLLTVISGCAELLDLEVRGDSRNLVKEIRAAAESAGALTKQLLTFSRQSILQPKILEVNTLLSVSEKMLRRFVEDNIQISLALEPDAGHVKVDPSEFDQMLLNLVMNARDAMPSGGEITISTSRYPEGRV
ncbi:MAG: PAS domain S-box protein, partial [Candidatus Eremiobacteraeota bacterium]|nr:PAS domain S-box protein [Candidatus Eremiobacteraeota bacterium]